MQVEMRHQLILYLSIMSERHYPRFGRHSQYDAPEKLSRRILTKAYHNNITRRNAELTEMMPSRTPSNSLLSANIKSLRLFRHICRLIPFILRTNEMLHRVTPVQSKIYTANWFRENANETDLVKIDMLIQHGYECIYEAEMTYVNNGYMYRYLMPNSHKFRDFGINKFNEKKGDRINLLPNSQFLHSFYRGSKSHVE